MSTRGAQFDRNLGDEAAARWTEWFARYGVNARDVAVPGWVSVDDDARTIRYRASHKVDGKHHAAEKCPDPDGAEAAEPNSMCKTQVVVEVDDPIAPFPTRLPPMDGHPCPTCGQTVTETPSPS